MKNLSVLFALQSCITFFIPPNILHKKLTKIKKFRKTRHFVAYNNHFIPCFSVGSDNKSRPKDILFIGRYNPLRYKERYVGWSASCGCHYRRDLGTATQASQFTGAWKRPRHERYGMRYNQSCISSFRTTYQCCLFLII